MEFKFDNYGKIMFAHVLIFLSMKCNCTWFQCLNTEELFILLQIAIPATGFYKVHSILLQVAMPATGFYRVQSILLHVPFPAESICDVQQDIIPWSTSFTVKPIYDSQESIVLWSTFLQQSWRCATKYDICWFRIHQRFSDLRILV